MLPDWSKWGICSLKIEGRERSPAYTRQVTRVGRQAIDSVMKEADAFKTQVSWNKQLAQLSEGSQTTLGAYERSWQ